MMKHLVATTALALILSAPAMAQTTQEQATQDQAAQDQAGQQQQMTAQNGFLQQMEPGDILAGELIGQDVYVARADDAVAERPADQEAAPGETATVREDQDAAADEPTAPEELAEDQEMTQDQQAQQDQQQVQQDQQQAQQGQQQAQQGQQQDRQMAQQNQQRTGDMQTIDRAQLDNMESIGQVSEVVLDQNGQVKAVVIGVGGFLGVGEREVAVDFERVTFAVDQEDQSQYYLITDTTAEELENAPEFERVAMRDGQMRDDAQRDAAAPAQNEQVARADDQSMAEQERGAEWRGDRQAFAPPAVEREGFQQAEAQEISADDMIGSNVYDVNDENIGSVSDVVIGQDGEVGYVVVDIGGFLGIGTHTVALGFDEVTVLHDDGWDDLRIYVEATQEQLEGMPEYAQAN